MSPTENVRSSLRKNKSTPCAQNTIPIFAWLWIIPENHYKRGKHKKHKQTKNASCFHQSSFSLTDLQTKITVFVAAMSSSISVKVTQSVCTSAHNLCA